MIELEDGDCEGKLVQKVVDRKVQKGESSQGGTPPPQRLQSVLQREKQEQMQTQVRRKPLFHQQIPKSLA